MKYIYAVENEAELAKYKSFAFRHMSELDDYIAYISSEYDVRELPKAVVLTSAENASRTLSSVPLPAFTNEHRIMFSPDLDVWRKIYKSQLDGISTPEAEEIRDYYGGINDRHLMQILGHELAHHSELFGDNFDNYFDGDIWFEEGMVEYISRKYFLTDAEFRAEKEVNEKLVRIYAENHNGEEKRFGEETYNSGLDEIFAQYWKSFLAVERIIGEKGGDVHAVFEEYHAWCESDKSVSLAEYFGNE